MAEKGILTADQEKFLADKLDEVLKLGGLLEIIDGYIFKALITFIDNKYGDLVKVEIKTKLSELATVAINEDLEAAEKLAAEIINMIVDIPVLDEEAEGLIFKGIVELSVGAVIKWIESRKAEPVKLKIHSL